MAANRKRGRRYAAGSHMTRGEFPRACHRCGKPTRLDNCWQETTRDGERRSWHHGCRLAAREETT